MKRILYTIAIVGFALGLTSCGKDLLKRDNLFEMEESNFYGTPDQMNQALSGVYSQMHAIKGHERGELMTEIMSDDSFGGGGPGNINAQDMDWFTKNHIVGLYDQIWVSTYTGVFRANKIIENIDKPKWDNDDQKNQLYGEALFMRAFYNHRLGTYWGQAPLITDTSMDPNQPKASGDQIFAQVASDLKKAIEIMPSNVYSNIPSGHATKWAAEALMARAFLFYTGYYKKASMPLAEGGEVTKADVQAWLVDLIDNSGHALVSDFRNLWPYSNNPDYPWAVTEGLHWVGEGSSNPESIFAIKFGPYAAFGDDKKYANQLQLFIGLRGNKDNQFGKGWGFATVNPQLWDSYEAGDLRKQGTIIDAKDKVNEAPLSTTYEYGKNRSMQETGYFNKKYMPVMQKDASGKWKGMYFLMYGGTDHFQLWNMSDQMLIRFSDVLLMAAELDCPKAQEYFDQVRTRAGLASIPVTLDAIKVERRHELALEGLRYHDLLRWHDAESAFAAVSNITIYNGGNPTKYNAQYRPETGGFLPIPQNQIALSAGVLVQNPGW